MPTMGNEAPAGGGAALRGIDRADLVDRRFGKGFLFMMVVPAACGAGTRDMPHGAAGGENLLPGGMPGPAAFRGGGQGRATPHTAPADCRAGSLFAREGPAPGTSAPATGRPPPPEKVSPTAFTLPAVTNDFQTLTEPRGGRSAAATGSARAGDPERAAPAGRILLVDDDSAIRGILTGLLENAGYRVRSAADGEAGWDALRAARFDLLITDHEMPRLTGLELLRRVRADLPPLPAIMISGFMPWDEDDLDWLLQPGAAIAKPFSFGALLAKVRELMDGHPAGLPDASRAGCLLALGEAQDRC